PGVLGGQVPEDVVQFFARADGFGSWHEVLLSPVPGTAPRRRVTRRPSINFRSLRSLVVRPVSGRHPGGLRGAGIGPMSSEPVRSRTRRVGALVRVVRPPPRRSEVLLGERVPQPDKADTCCLLVRLVRVAGVRLTRVDMSSTWNIFLGGDPPTGHST